MTIRSLFLNSLVFLALALAYNADGQTAKSEPSGKVVPSNMARDFNDDFEVFNLGDGVNSIYNEYNPVLSHDGIYMLYTSRSDSTTGKTIDSDDGLYKEDIRLARNDNGRYTHNGITSNPLSKFTSSVNTRSHEAPVYISENDETIILFKDNDLWFTKKVDGQYSEPMKYPKSINFKYYHRHASLTADGRTMYFTAEVLDKKLNKFHLDIFKTELNENDIWSKPEHLPDFVNTLFNEDSPEISADGNTLFFSSDRTDGFGGYDIYYVKLNSGDSVIYRLDEPINSAANDIYFKLLADSSSAFFSSNRLKGYGGMDIYKVSFYNLSKGQCAENSDEIRINGSNSIPVRNHLILTSDGSKIGGQNPRRTYWVVDGEIVNEGRRFEMYLDSIKKFEVNLYVSSVDSISQEFIEGCKSVTISVLADSSLLNIRIINSAINTLDFDLSESELLKAIPEADNELALQNDVITTYSNVPVYVSVLENDPATRKGVLQLTSVSRPQNGSNIIESANKGLILYYPANNYKGMDAFAYQAKDQNGIEGQAWVGVRVLDKQPIFVSKLLIEDTAFTKSNNPVSIYAFENDLMEEGKRYKISEFTAPQNGALRGIDLNEGIFIYQPSEGFVGQDVFTYAVDEPAGKRERAFIRVYVGNESEFEFARTSPDFASTRQGDMVSLNVLLNDDFKENEKAKIISVSKSAMGAIQIYDAQRGTIVYAPLTSFVGNDNFTYTVQLANGKTYVEAVSISAEEGEQVIASVEEDQKIDLTSVDQTKVDTKDKPALDLKSIYFDFDKTYIRSDARKLMAENIQLLKDNPTVVIQVVSHCDSRGSKAYNQLLSAKRARSTVAYLTSHGIDESRIAAAVGVGEEDLINDCGDGVPCPNVDHQKNRRSDLIVVGSLK